MLEERLIRWPVGGLMSVWDYQCNVVSDLSVFNKKGGIGNDISSVFSRHRSC